MLHQLIMRAVLILCIYCLVSSVEADTVAQWLFDEGGGAVVHDSSGNNHHGDITFFGVDSAWSTDSPFEPDDNDGSLAGLQEVRVPNAPELNPTGDFTVEAWIKIPPIPGYNPYIISKRGTGPVGFTGYWLEMLPGAGVIDFITGNGVGQGLSVSEAVLGELGGPYENLNFDVDVWYHIAGVHTATENILYVNGISNGGAPAAPMVGNSDLLTLGYYVTGDHYGNFSKDDFRISNVALSPSELGYNAKLLPTPGLGDFNGDLVVNGADFLLWQQGGSPMPLSPGDLSTWKNTFGTTYAPGFGAGLQGVNVPEPSSLVLAIGILSGVALFKRFT